MRRNLASTGGQSVEFAAMIGVQEFDLADNT